MSNRQALDLSGLDQFKASTLLNAAGALIDRPVSGSPSTGAPMQVRLELIDFDPSQPRRTLCEAALAELAATIRDQGVLEPVSLRRHPTTVDRFIVNRGERRVRASRLAGLDTVPAFMDERVDPYAQAIENLQREELSPFDLARFIADRESEGDSRAEIARKLHKPRSLITELACLIDAPNAVREAFESGRVSDTRGLYQLARASMEKSAAVDSALADHGPITREKVVQLALPQALFSAATDGSAVPKESRTVLGTKSAQALLVEHAGRRGRLGWSGWPGRRTGEVRFDDGTRQVLELADLKLIAWTAR